MLDILIAGAGQIGSRHLQGMLLSQLALNIIVIDPSKGSLEIAKSRAEEVIIGNQATHVTYQQNYKQIKSADIVIIATTADIRFTVFKQIINKINFKAVVFEKVLFQKEEDYAEVASLLNRHSITAVVNCPRRMYPVYQKIKSLLANEKSINLSVSGTAWGMACNSIHFIDLFSFLTGTTDFQLDISELDNHISQSERNGFYEIYGLIKGVDNSGNSFNLSCNEDDRVEFEVIIMTPNYRVKINEIKGKFIISTADKDIVDSFSIIYQSQLTDRVIEELLEGCSALTKYFESSQHHLPFIRDVKKHIETRLNKKLSACPIT